MSKLKVVCENCGEVFYKYLSHISGQKYHFCSRECLYKGRVNWNKGKAGTYTTSWKGGYHSEETKRKIGRANRGENNGMYGYKYSSQQLKKMSENRRGRKPPGARWIREGKKVPRETRRRLSEAIKKAHAVGKYGKKWREKISGKNASNWKGGITPENERIRRTIEFRLWREAVFARDNWTCQKCLVQGGKLHPHHIEDFSTNPALRFDISNGITLCDEDHRMFHKKYGKNNTSQKQLEEFLNE